MAKDFASVNRSDDPNVGPDNKEKNPSDDTIGSPPPTQTPVEVQLAGKLPFEEDYQALEIVVSPTYLRVRRGINFNSSKGSGGTLALRIITLTSGDATPSVKNANLVITAGTTAITNFDDGIPGQCIIVKATGNITITNGTPILLAGATNYAMTSNDTLTLCMFTTGVWTETARSVN